MMQLLLYPIAINIVSQAIKTQGIICYCYTSDRNVQLWLVQIASRGVS